MFSLTGEGPLDLLDGGAHLGIKFAGLHAPLALLSSSGQPLGRPEPYTPTRASFTGTLPPHQGNLETPRGIAVDLLATPAPGVDAPLTHLLFTGIGNLGSAPTINPKGDRFSASMAFGTGDKTTTWLRVVSYPHRTITQAFADLPRGAQIAVCGFLESFEYNGKPRLQLNLLAFSKLPRSSGGNGGPPPAPTVLYSAGSYTPTEIQVGDVAPEAMATPPVEVCDF